MSQIPRHTKTYLDSLIKPGEFVCDFSEGVSDNDTAAFMAGFLVDKNVALHDTSSNEPETWSFPLLSYLYTIGFAFVNALSRTADLEVLRERAVPEKDPIDLRKLPARVPFILGSEFVNTDGSRTSGPTC